MAKSIFLALFVLGVAQALVVPEHDFNNNEKSKVYYSNLAIDFIDALLEEEQHKVPGTDLQDSHQINTLKELFNELPRINLIAGISAIKVLPGEEHHKVKRAADEIKNQLETEIIPAVGELVDDMAKNGVNKTGVDNIKNLFNKLENGLDSLGRALDNDGVKNIWKFLCSFYSLFHDDDNLAENLVSATELVEQPKSFGHKACSEKTLKKTQELIQNAKKMIKKINEYFTKERLEIITQKLKVVSQKVKQAAKAVYGNNPSAGHIALTTARFLNPIVGGLYPIVPRRYWDSLEKKLG